MMYAVLLTRYTVLDHAHVPMQIVMTSNSVVQNANCTLEVLNGGGQETNSRKVTFAISANSPAEVHLPILFHFHMKC